jgi:hypothetical protein
MSGFEESNILKNAEDFASSETLEILIQEVWKRSA